MIHKILVFILVLFACSLKAQSEPATVFAGRPSIKIILNGNSPQIEKLSDVDQANSKCIISRIDGKYYWASRENKELLRHAAGAFVTFHAVDGSGYVRLSNPEDRKLLSGSGYPGSQFDYVEHVLMGLASITYNGQVDPFITSEYLSRNK